MVVRRYLLRLPTGSNSVRSVAPPRRTFGSSTRRHAKLSKRVSKLFDDYERYMRIRPSLDGPTNIEHLEDILKKHEESFRIESPEGDRKGSPVRLLYSAAQLYTEGLLEVRRPAPAMKFLRKLIGILKDRMEFDGRFTESWIVTQQLILYRIIRDFGNNPAERWQLVQEAKSMVEQIPQESWDDQDLPLRDMQAQILQYQAAEEGELYNDPLKRNLALKRLVVIHEEILKLGGEFKTASAEEIRSRSLRAICGFKEEQGKNYEYQSYARKLHKSMKTKVQLAKSLTPLLTCELLSSHVTLCKAYARASKWDEAVEIATNGLKMAKDIGRDDNNCAHVEICQLLVYRSRGYLILEQPVSALDDARGAVKEANSIPWTEEHPDEDVSAEYPNEYRKYRWQNFAQLNLIDIVYGPPVLHPEEHFGLELAERGRIFASSTLPGPEKDFYETQYRRKRIRALTRLKRWHDVLAECQVLLRKSVEALSSSDVSYLKEIIGQMVDTCDDAVSCLKKLGKINLSRKLEDEIESFETFIDGNIPLESYISRARRLHRRFDAIYKEATTADPQTRAETNK